MRNYSCTTQVPNALFDELLPTLTFAELKVLLAVNRATWGWVEPKTGARKQWAWLACSRMQEKTGLSKRAITNAIAALVKRRLLIVADNAGNELYDPNERRGQTKLYYALRYPQESHRQGRTSAPSAEVDQQRMLINKTNKGINQRTMSRTTGEQPRRGLIGSFMQAAISPMLWERLHEPISGNPQDASANS